MTASGEVRVPKYSELHWPTIEAVRALGGSASIEEILERVIADQEFSDAQQQVLHKDGPTTEIEYRLAWARSYLKGMGLLINSQRGVWSLTEDGRVASAEAVATLHTAYLATLRERAKSRRSTQVGDDQEVPEEVEWSDELLETMMQMPPEAFERLSQRLLREADFVSVNVTGRTGDGGIDGVGVYRMSLVSFPVFFQCKRYRGSVGAGTVRDFRGAMAGRGDKGLLITTGTFTRDAKAEATRDGAPPVDLIDGQRLCELLKRYNLGVTVTTRTEQDVTVDRSFFQSI